MRVLVIGATGLLGRALLKEWAGAEIIGISSRDADVRDRSQLRQHFVRCRPDWTVLTAAHTDVDGCERDPKTAFDVNAIGASNVALECRGASSRLLFLSTDYVFDGAKASPYDPDDEINPLNVYGRSKAQGEQRVRTIMPDACILRTSWLFGATGRCFPNTILESAAAGKALSVVNDQIGRPTYNRDLARAIIKLCCSNARGTLHASNSGSCSWHEFAVYLLRAAGVPNVNIRAVCSEELDRRAKRPKQGILSLSGLERYGAQMRTWQETVTDYLHERRAYSFAEVAQPGVARSA